MTQYRVAYRKTKRGNVIKVRDYSLPSETTTEQSSAQLSDRGPRAPRLHARNLGNIAKYVVDKDTENRVLLIEHDVPQPDFTEGVLRCLPAEGSAWTIPSEEFKVRADLRDVNVCSVDPPGCTDIDDALHYKDLGKDKCEVGVHIADVSYFVQPNSALDQEAANRGTTVYLSDRRIDMIPGLLSSNLCSLVEHQDRLAFSAIWTIRKSTAEVLDVKFTRSIINSKASLTYEKAQSMIDDKSNNGILHKSLRGLNELAKKLKKKRVERGALVLARADEIRFVETESETYECGTGMEIQQKKMVDTNSMVEECMLLANIAVANKLLSSFPQQALLRRHPKPTRENFEDLIESAKSKGFKIRVEDGKSLADSLDKAQMPNDYFFNLMLRMIATRCMTPAAYFCSGCVDPKITSFTHFGLAADLYTHFTSPIRRYADLLVHRLLAIAIGSGQMDRGLSDMNNIQLMCDQINYRHRMAQLASRASARLHTVLYIKSKKELEEEARVFFIRQNAVQILIPSIALEYTYFLKPSEDWQYDEVGRHQTNVVKKITLKQFDKLKVRISFSDRKDMRFSDKIQVKIIEPALDRLESQDGQMEIDDEEVKAISDSDKALWFYEELPEKAFYKDMKKKIRLDLSEEESSRPVVVMPGDVLEKYISKETTMLGPGLVRNDGKVVATKCGILKMRNNNLFWVDCHQKRYVAARGECVIGIIRSRGSLQVQVDINSANTATLSLLAFEGANKKNKPNFNVGDLVYAKILSASKHVETELVCVNSDGKRNGLGQIGDKGGVLITLSIDTVRVLLSPECNLLENLGQSLRYEIALGMNGRVWINSCEPSTLVEVVKQLRYLDAN